MMVTCNDARFFIAFILLNLATLLGGQSNRDTFYILLNSINIYSCRGITNQIQIDENDVQITNEKGNQVYYIKAPGNYTLNFNNILVGQDFGYLTGEISATLQVPIIEGPAGIRFDLPYTMIPETGLLNQKCDQYSGIVERNGRQYCRYCDMCEISNQVERDLNRGRHKYLPELDIGLEQPFSPHCTKINSDEYQFSRSITLPGKSELERQAKKQFQGIDGEIKKRLDKGSGRFQVFLNLISSDKEPLLQSAWFSGSHQCRCCSAQKSNDASCRVFSFLYCNREDCKSAWAQQCLHRSASIVACYTVEFNYRFTEDYGRVLAFLRKNGYPDQEKVTRGVPPSLKSTTTASTTTVSMARTTKMVDTDDKNVRRRCIVQMPARLTHLRRYCMIFWNAKLCCTHCSSVLICH